MAVCRMTFLGGGRACIGFKFSQLEMSTCLVGLCRGYMVDCPRSLCRDCARDVALQVHLRALGQGDPLEHWWYSLPYRGYGHKTGDAAQGWVRQVGLKFFGRSDHGHWGMEVNRFHIHLSIILLFCLKGYSAIIITLADLVYCNWQDRFSYFTQVVPYVPRSGNKIALHYFASEAQTPSDIPWCQCR